MRLLCRVSTRRSDDICFGRTQDGKYLVLRQVPNRPAVAAEPQDAVAVHEHQEEKASADMATTTRVSSGFLFRPRLFIMGAVIARKGAEMQGN